MRCIINRLARYFLSSYADSSSAAIGLHHDGGIAIHFPLNEHLNHFTELSEVIGGGLHLSLAF